MARKRRRRSGGIPFGSSTGGLLIAAAGVLLVVMSGPRLIGAVNATAGEPAIEKLKRGEEIGPPAIDRARKAFATAARSIPRDYRAYRDLALIEMVAARMLPPGSDEWKDAVNRAIGAGRMSLGNNPAQPYVWLRLAQAELMQDGVGARSAFAFAMSLETGPQVIGLMKPRVILGLILWPVLDERQRDRVLAQIRGLARYNARMLAETVLHRAALPLVQKALANDPDLMRAFLDVYLQRRTPGYRPPL